MYVGHTSSSARHETLGAVEADTSGVTVTAGGAAHLKGAWVSIGGTTSFAYESFMIFLTGDTASEPAYRIDIGITVGAETYVIATDLVYQIRDAAQAGYLQLALHIPAGAQLAARCQSDVASATIEVVIVGSSSGLLGMPGFSEVISLIPSSTARSHGIAIDTGSTVVNTKPAAYTTLTSSATKGIAGIFGLIDNNNDTSRAAVATWLLDIATGSSGAEYNILSDFMLYNDATVDQPFPYFLGPFSVHLSSGSRLAARAQSSVGIAGDRTFGLGLYGYVP